MRTVLLVEDELLIRMMLADELRGRGLIIVETQNADEALTHLQNREPVDLVLTDVQLPGSMDGIGLARWVREERPELKVVIASGNISCAPGGEVPTPSSESHMHPTRSSTASKGCWFEGSQVS